MESVLEGRLYILLVNQTALVKTLNHSLMKASPTLPFPLYHLFFYYASSLSLILPQTWSIHRYLSFNVSLM